MADNANGTAVSSRSWSYESLKNSRPLTLSVQHHLKRVYLTLAGTMVASALGAYVHLLWSVGGICTFLGCIGCMLWLYAAPVQEENLRMRLLMAAAVLEGANIGPLIKLALALDMSLLVTAFGGTALAFACFSLAALVAQRRQFLYLGAVLGSALSMLLWSSVASVMFGASVATLNFQIYLGLLVFLGYVVFDTQMIVECAFRGDLDYIGHAFQLYADFVGVFVRVLAFMVKTMLKCKK